VPILLSTAADEQRGHATFLLQLMHQVTDAGAEMAEPLKLIGLPHRLKLLGDDKPTH